MTTPTDRPERDGPEAAPALAVDDCFLHDGRRLPHDEAIGLLRSRIRPVVGTEAVALADVAGRILAAGVRAPRPIPLSTNSAVDGYAFAARDYDRAQGARLQLAGRAAAGHAFDGSVAAGSAVAILTGAVIPAGLDTTAMQEDCRVEGAGEHAIVHIPGGLKAGANVRKAGEDVAAGAEVLGAGHLIRPQDVAALASLGLAEATVFRRIRCAVLSSGDEIVRPGDARSLAPGEVYDANAPMLAALARYAGVEVSDLGVLPDRFAAVREGLGDAARRFDVVLTSGGASRGAEDHMAAALGALGSRHFWQIAVKPGRPMMLGQIGGTVVTGLPGNPVAVFVCFLLYVWPMLRVLGGASWPEPRRLRLPAAFAFTGRKPGRREFWRGMYRETGTGLAVDKFMRDGSGLISGLVAADGLIDIPEATGDVAPGDLVDFIPFTEYGFPPRPA